MECTVSNKPAKMLRRLSSPLTRSMLVCCTLLALLATCADAQTRGLSRRRALSQTNVRRAAVPADAPSGFFPGLIHYFAGDGPALSGSYADGSLPTQVPLIPVSLASDSKGNIYIAVNSGPTSGALYVVFAGGAIPAMLANVTTLANPASTPVAGRIYQVAGQGSGCGSCDGLPLNQVYTGAFYGLAFDSHDNLYYADQTNWVVRKIDASTSNVTTVAGTWATQTGNVTGDGGPATAATFFSVTDIKLDAWGNLYINDPGNDLVHVVYSGTQPPPVLAAEGVTVDASQQNYIFAIGGTFIGICSAPGSCGDGGPAGTALFYNQTSIAVDSAGNVYVADAVIGADAASTFPYVRVIYAGGAVPPLLNLSLNPSGGNSVAPTSGYIYAVTGYALATPFAPCLAAGCGDGGLAGSVQFGTNLNGGTFQFITVDALGNLYVADEFAFAVRKIDTSGYASTIAGIDDPTQPVPTTLPVPDGSSAVGTYLANPAFLAFDPSNNLYIVDNDLVWQVTPLAGQTITFADIANVTYGASPIPLAATASSGLPVQYSVSTTPTGIAHLNGTDLVLSGAGSVSVTASQPGDSVYSAAASVTKSFTVDPAPLTVTADPASKVQGDPNPVFTATITGFVNGDTAQTPGAYTGAPAFSTTATTSSPYGTYPVVPSIGTLSSINYTFPAANFIAGTLTVTGTTPQTITFPPFSPSSVPYGQGPILLSATATSGGPVTFLCVSGPCQLSGTNGSTLTITGAGTIVIKATQTGYQQYKAAPDVLQTLVVTPALLTVTGPSVTLPFGTPVDPAMLPPPTITGFVGADTQSTVLTGSAAYSVPAGTPSVGTYPIVVTLGSLTLLPSAAANYSFAPPVNGSLVILGASQSINFNPIPAGQNYGQQIPLTAVATSGLPVDFTVSGPVVLRFGNTLVPTGVGTATVTAVQNGDGNYAAAQPVSQTFTIAPAPLNIQALNLTREQGAPNPTLTYQIGCTNPVPGCWVGNDTDVPAVITGLPDISTTATDSSSPGTYPITIAQGTLAAPNYTFVFINGTLTVTPPGDYTITANPSTLTIPRGQSGQSTITITPNNNYQGTVTLSCGQLPANVTCVVSPSSYNFPGSQNPNGSENPAQGTITINTMPGIVVGSLRTPGKPLLAALALPGFFAGLVLLAARRRASKWWTPMRGIALLLLAFSTLALSSCGGSTTLKAAAPGTVTISINGSGSTPSGNGTVSATVPLTVVIQ